MKDMKVTKKKILESAILLFNTNGYSGTSVRDIAKKAGVNVSMVSYYFGGKKGLLEYLMTTFLEGCSEIMEECYTMIDKTSAQECLLHMVREILMYEKENYHLARLVHREVTLDTFLIREIMTTYLTKERFIFKAVIELGIKRKEFRAAPVMITILHLKSLITMPFLHPQYMVEVLHLHPQEQYFVDRYFKEIESWVYGDLSIETKRSPFLLPIAHSI